MQNIFLGFVSTIEKEDPNDNNGQDDNEATDEDDDVDGIPLDGAALLKSAQKSSATPGMFIFNCGINLYIFTTPKFDIVVFVTEYIVQIFIRGFK